MNQFPRNMQTILNGHQSHISELHQNSSQNTPTQKKEFQINNMQENHLRSRKLRNPLGMSNILYKTSTRMFLCKKRPEIENVTPVLRHCALDETICQSICDFVYHISHFLCQFFTYLLQRWDFVITLRCLLV